MQQIQQIIVSNERGPITYHFQSLACFDVLVLLQVFNLLLRLKQFCFESLDFALFNIYADVHACMISIVVAWVPTLISFTSENISTEQTEEVESG